MTSWLIGDDFNYSNGGIEPANADYLRSLVESVAREGMIGFDVGCYTGWTALQVAPIFVRNAGYFYLADWFQGSENTQVGHHRWGEVPSAELLLATLSNVERGGLLGVASVIVATTENLSRVIADEIADYVYIGADHRYSAVKRDIEAWLPKVRPGGILCGHAFNDVAEGSAEWIDMLLETVELDVNPQGVHFGVTRAVHELLPGYEQGGTQMWSYRKGKS